MERVYRALKIKNTIDKEGRVVELDWAWNFVIVFKRKK